MIKAGYSPSVRLFEAAACGVPIISDYWQGLDEFLVPDKEILISISAADTLSFLKESRKKKENKSVKMLKIKSFQIIQPNIGHKNWLDTIMN
jgi:spore maturation protein CgeB